MVKHAQPALVPPSLGSREHFSDYRSPPTPLDKCFQCGRFERVVGRLVRGHRAVTISSTSVQVIFIALRFLTFTSI